MGGRDGLFSLNVPYILVLLQVADEVSANELPPLYFRQAFSHSGDALLVSPVLGSKTTAVRFRLHLNWYIFWG